MNRMSSATAAAFLGALALGACSDNRTDDVVQAPAPGATPAPVTEQTADNAALALGLTRRQLEDADLKAPDNTDLGDIETVVLDANGALTHLVVELEGPGDIKVLVPAADVRAGPAPANPADDRDLSTDLTAAQLAALPRWTPPTTR